MMTATMTRQPVYTYAKTVEEARANIAARGLLAISDPQPTGGGLLDADTDEVVYEWVVDARPARCA